MRLRDIGEFGFIERIRSGCLIRQSGVVQAIGDDAAAVVPEEGKLLLVTTDLLVERIHFLLESISGFDLGYKALAVNLSDIAAMGGSAREAFVSIAVPERISLQYLDEVYRGMRSLGGDHGVNILGGDTTGSKSDLVVNVAVTGWVAPDRMLLRSAARAGDVVFVTGTLGESRAGLHMIVKGIPPDSPELETLLARHFRPRPHTAEGRFLAACDGVHAAIDVSDGIGSDIAHIARASGVGVVLRAGRLPVSGALRSFCRRFGFQPEAFALAGGEDYVLICTVAAERASAVSGEFQRAFKRPLTPVGEITSHNNLVLVDGAGRTLPLTPEGWDHFRSAEP